MRNSNTSASKRELDDKEFDGLFTMARAQLVSRGSSSASTSNAAIKVLEGMGVFRAANEPAVPNLNNLKQLSGTFGQGVSQPVISEPLQKTSAKERRPIPSDTGDKTSTKTTIDADSKEILRYLSEDFVLWTQASAQVAFHIESGDKLSKEGFISFGAKHYGHVIFVDENGNQVDRVSSGQIWWAWDDPARRVVKTIIMEPTMVPEHEGDPTVLNRWYTLKKTMVEPNYTATEDDILPLLEHLMFISDGDEVAVLYFLNWLATMYQRPGVKIPVAVLMYSKFGGVGKSIIHRLLSKVFGKPLVTACTGKVLQKNFDDAIEHKRIVFINEVARSEKADGYENFKSQISEEDAQFEGKGRAAKEIRNIAHYIITTNNLDALPMMQGDRRIAVLMCNEPPRDAKYYKRLVEWIDGPGAPALANVLRTWEFPTDWNAHAPAPQTEAARNMQKASRDELELLLAELVEAGTEPCDKDIIIVDDLCAQMNTLFSNSLRRPANRTSVGKALQALHAERCEKRIEGPDGKTPNRVFYLIRNSEQWKEATPKQRGDHLKTGARLFAVPVETPSSEVADNE